MKDGFRHQHFLLQPFLFLPFLFVSLCLRGEIRSGFRVSS